MQREQTGHVYRRNGWWILRYRQIVNRGGELKINQPAVRLVPVGPHYRSKASLRDLVKEKLEEINRQNREPEAVVTIGDFVERLHLPFVKAHKRPSTAKGYRDVWEDHLRSRVADVLLRGVRTSMVQSWLSSIAAQDKTKAKEPLRRETLKRIKSALSGIFKYAKQQGYFDGQNPVTDTQVPKAPAGQMTYAYSISEISQMLSVVLSPMASAVLAVAAYTALRRGEIEALCWEDWRDEGLWISRSKWNQHILEPKTQASGAPVPVIPSLAEKLRSYRAHLGNPASGPMFPGARLGKPASLNNILNRVIKPALNRCAVCGDTKTKHISNRAAHDYKRDERLPRWRGWHAFRRGLATNLHDLGVDDKTIQSILRHSNVSVTQRCYIKTLPKQTVAAMSHFESALCAERAPKAGSENAAGLIN
jgi:integrase